MIPLESQKYTFLGVVTKTYGTSGWVILKFDPQYVDKIQNKELIFLDIDKKSVPFFIEAVEIRNQKSALIKFLDYDTEYLVADLVGAKGYFLSGFSVPGEADLSHIVGYKLEAPGYGMIGEINDWVDQPGNPLIIVVTPEGKELYLPVHHSLIEKIDQKNRVVYYKPPEGLLELEE